MNIFEDDEDHEEFLRLLVSAYEPRGITVLAWCLMSNHVHLLVHGHLSEVSKAMRSALSRYAAFFNFKHGHVGHLFQGRFSSTPILDDAQLLVTMRYIHGNPARAGICDIKSYRWSSYSEYMEESRISNTTMILEMLGGPPAFELYHAEEGTDGPKEPKAVRRAILDARAKELAMDIAGGAHALSTLPSLERPERDALLSDMKDAGLSVRQIERLTGIGRNIVQRARRTSQ